MLVESGVVLEEVIVGVAFALEEESSWVCVEYLEGTYVCLKGNGP